MSLSQSFNLPSLFSDSDQIQRLEEMVQSTKDKLEESRELLKTNENGTYMYIQVCIYMYCILCLNSSACINIKFVLICVF